MTNYDVIIKKSTFSMCTSDEDLALLDFVHRLFRFSSVKRPNQSQILPTVPVWLLGTRLDELNLVVRKWFVPHFSLIIVVNTNQLLKKVLTVERRRIR